MSVYGATRLVGCDSRLVQLFTRVGERRAVQIIQGPRTVQQEVDAIATHHSALKDPMNSLHVIGPGRPVSLAVDAGPWPLDWNDINAFSMLALVVKSCALELGVSITWGGNWETFKDYSHYELTQETT